MTSCGRSTSRSGFIRHSLRLCHAGDTTVRCGDEPVSNHSCPSGSIYLNRGIAAMDMAAMTERRTFLLREPVAAHTAIMKAWEHAKGWLGAGGGDLIMEIRPLSKTRDQEEKYHAIIGEIAVQAQHLGSKWQAHDWKRLLLDQFARETGRTHGKVIPNLDQSGVVEVGLQSRKFSIKDGAEFIEWLHAWAANNGVELSQ